MALAAALPVSPQRTEVTAWPHAPFIGPGGTPIRSGKVCSYRARTSIPLATYADSTGSIANSNPVMLDSTGRANIWLGPGTYKLVIRAAGSDSTCNTGAILTVVDDVTGVTPQWITPQSFGAKCDGSTDDTAAIGNALAHASLRGKGLEIAYGSICLSGPQTIATAARIRGPGTLRRKAGGSSPVLTITGNDVSISGLTIDCNATGAAGGNCIAVNGTSGFSFSASTVKNGADGEQMMELNAIKDADVSGNRLTAFRGAGIIVTDGSMHVRIAQNYADHSSARDGSTAGPCFGVRQGNTIPGAGVAYITIEDNSMIEAVHFGIEAGNFQSGSTDTALVHDIVVSGNVIELANPAGSNSCMSFTGPRVCGGISFSNMSKSAVSGNTVNANDQKVEIAGIELTACVRCSARSNSVDLGLNATGSAKGIGGACRECVITANTVYGFGDIVENSGIGNADKAGFLNTDNTTITHNIIYLPSGSAANSGIEADCHKGSGSLQHNVIANNVIIGTGGSNKKGVEITRDDTSCTLEYETVGPDMIYGVATGYSIHDAVATQLHYGELDDVSTPVALSGAVSLAP